MKTLKQNSLLSLAVFSALGLSACNLELQLDPATMDQINKTSTGVITSLSNLQVNGVTYDTKDTQVLSDGKEVETSDLKQGMVVSVTGTENSDGTGKATVIEFEDVTEGEVLSNNTNLNNTLNVMGQTVYVDSDTIFDSRDASVSSIDAVTPGNVLEVSGHSSGNGEIWATRIEVKKTDMEYGDEIEVKGNISNLTETSFDIGNLTVNYENARISNDFNGKLTENAYVEVSSFQSLNDANYMLADSIELKNQGEIEVKHSNNDQEVEVKGLVTDVISDNEVKVNGASVLLNTQTRFENGIASQITNGSIVEVEGYIDPNGNFQATKLEFENGLEDSDSSDSYDSNDSSVNNSSDLNELNDDDHNDELQEVKNESYEQESNDND